MKIQYLCHRVPYPPNKGEKIRAFHQLCALAERHEVDLFTLADDPADFDHRAKLEEFCRSVHIARIHRKWARVRTLPCLFSRKALTLPYFYSSELRAEVRRHGATRNYDRVFVYCSAMAQYIEKQRHCPLIIDLVDVDSDKWRQYSDFARFPLSTVFRREARSLASYERSIADRADCAIVSTEREAQLLRQIAPRAHVEAVPNGVDVDYFSSQAVPREPGSSTVIFTGDMAYFPNVTAVKWFAHSVLPLISRAVPEVRFLIVGRHPAPAVRAFALRPNVEVTGYVPDVRQYLARAAVAVAPFQIAAGIQNKILEAMAYGLPVVATTRAARGLSAGVRELVAKADTAADFAARVVTLLRDSAAAHDSGTRGRLHVMQDYRWGTALGRIVSLVENPAQVDRRQEVAVPGAGGS